MREKTAEDVYHQFLADGEYKVIEKESAIVKKMLTIARENAAYIDFLLKQKSLTGELSIRFIMMCSVNFLMRCFAQQVLK